MKKIVLILSIVGVFFTPFAQAQTYKFITTGFSVMERTSQGEWGNWSDLQETKLVILLDTTKNRLVVYSQEVQWYDILAYEKEEETNENIVYPFSCKDEEGYAVTISIITRKNQANRKQLYITRNNYILVYNIENYPEK